MKLNQVIRAGLVFLALGAFTTAHAGEVVAEFKGARTMQTAEFEVKAPWILDWRTTGDYARDMAVVRGHLAGFPVVLIFAWAYELTPDGLKRDKDVDKSRSIAPQTGKKLNHAIMVLMAVAIAFASPTGMRGASSPPLRISSGPLGQSVATTGVRCAHGCSTCSTRSTTGSAG